MLLNELMVCKCIWCIDYFRLHKSARINMKQRLQDGKEIFVVLSRFSALGPMRDHNVL